MHGGVRYLEQASETPEPRRVPDGAACACGNEFICSANAPHLAHASEFLVPVYSWGRAAILPDGNEDLRLAVGEKRFVPKPICFQGKRRSNGCRASRAEGLRGAVAYSDGQFDDARYDFVGW